MSARKSISKTTRFEVFKRDSFTCQYCGRKAPDVVLELEHVHPVSKGGGNDILNLVTSCEACNDGKGARTLDDSSVVERSRRQVEQLQERREQIEMMLEWKEGLRGIDEYAATAVAEYVAPLLPGYTINEPGMRSLRRWLARYSVDELTSAAEISTRQYLEYGDDGLPTPDSVTKAWGFIPRIARVRRSEKDDPGLGELFYARGIARRRCGYFNDQHAIEYLRQAYDLGADLDVLQNIARRCQGWADWKSEMLTCIADLQGKGSTS